MYFVIEMFRIFYNVFYIVIVFDNKNKKGFLFCIVLTYAYLCTHY